MVIKKVSLALSRTDAHFKMSDLEVSKETNKSYILLDNTRIKKDKIGVVDTIFVESVRLLQYFVYCLEDSVEESKRKLVNTVESKVSDLKTSVNSLEKTFNQFIFEKTNFDEDNS